MREVIFFVASIAMAAVLTAAAVLLQPESPLWKWLLSAGTAAFMACGLVMLIDLAKPDTSRALLFGIGIGFTLLSVCSIAIYFDLPIPGGKPTGRSSILMDITGVTFSDKDLSSFAVGVHLRNPGPPSTIKDGRLTISIGDRILATLMAHDFSTPGHLSPDLRQMLRGPYLSTEPLVSGAEINAGLTYFVQGNAKQQFGMPGAKFHLVATDVNNRDVSSDYILPPSPNVTNPLVALPPTPAPPSTPEKK